MQGTADCYHLQYKTLIIPLIVFILRGDKTDNYQDRETCHQVKIDFKICCTGGIDQQPCTVHVVLAEKVKLYRHCS